MTEALAPFLKSRLVQGPEAGAELHANALVGAMLHHEAAMARCFAHFGVLRQDEAMSIASTCRPELFDAEQLLRETQRELALGLETAPPLIRRLRDTVELFNPKAARHVFRAGRWDIVQKNALQVLTQQWADALDLEVAAITALLEPQHMALAARLRRCQQRLQGVRQYALQLQLASTDADAMARSPEFVDRLMQELGMEALPHAATHAALDDWIALGAEYGLLTQCLTSVALDTAIGLPDAERERMRATAQRTPLAVAQWLAEGPTLHASGTAAAREFWDILWPLWTQVLQQTALTARSLHLHLEQQDA